jgi:aspartyl-tRNA(Asn)/glutamyl-tRNA(Gln) amidotransferase subunit A
VGNSIAVYYVLAVSEASSNLSRFDGVRFGTRAPGASKAGSLEEFYAANRSLFGAEVKRRILLGTFSLSSGYADEYFLRAAKVRALIARDFEAVFQKVDCILSPVAPTTAFRAGEKNSDPLQMYLNDLYTVPANLAGIPAITVPWSWDEEGLPVGIQLMGPAGGDAALIDIGRALEALQLGGVA